MYLNLRYTKISLNSKLLLSKMFSDQFGENFCFTIINFPHIFSLVDFFLSTLLQPLCLVTEKFFFQKQYTASAIESKMTLVNIGPHVILHQKIYVPWAVDFVGRSKGVPAPCGATSSCVPQCSFMLLD